MLSVLRNVLLMLALACSLSVLSISIPSRVDGPQEMRSVALGWPIPYLLQDRSILDPPTWPRYYNIGSPWEYPLRLRGKDFLANTALISAMLLAAYGWRALAARRGRESVFA